MLIREPLSTDHTLSKEEQLLRERQRLTETGITSYFPTSDGEKIMIPAGNHIHIAERKDSHFVIETSHPCNGAMDPKWSADGHVISFVRNDDIWVLDLRSKTEHQVTSDHVESSKKAAGVSKFILQEEFDRYTGYWWSPECTNDYKILYLVEDEAEVTRYGIPQPGYTGEIDNYEYPLAGGKNTTFSVWIASFTFSSGEHSSSFSVKKTNILPQLTILFPWVEYIVRAGWMPSGKTIWLQLLDRLQQHTALVELQLDPSHGAPKIICEEHSDLWINVTDIIHVLKDERIIWASERTGFRHLYMLTPSPSGPHTSTPITGTGEHGGQREGKERESEINEGQREWEEEWGLLGDPQLHVDEERQLVYFVATYDTPLEPHLYVASYANKSVSNISRLTELGGSYSGVTMDASCTTFVAKWSSISSPPQATIFKLKFENSSIFPTAVAVSRIASMPLTSYFPATPPKIFSFHNKHGVKLFGCYFLPTNYDPSKQYRTLVRVYGGPHVQLVTNSYELTNQPEIQMYNALGFICVVVDNTGSNNRGLKFEGLLRNKMGTIEISDQVDGLEYLISQGIGIDKNKIGITGWSYGGYLSLMAIGQRPDIFKCSIPKCPVVLWEAYDTGYTERYMGIPPSEGYDNGSVLKYVSTFPDQDNRVLLVHGMQDENVHFSNTVQLIDALITANKPHHIMLLPKERHGCQNVNTRRYLLVQCAWFLLNYL
jgi:dipeptidyl-peptidase 9